MIVFKDKKQQPDYQATAWAFLLFFLEDEEVFVTHQGESGTKTETAKLSYEQDQGRFAVTIAGSNMVLKFQKHHILDFTLLGGKAVRINTNAFSSGEKRGSEEIQILNKTY